MSLLNVTSRRTDNPFSEDQLTHPVATSAAASNPQITSGDQRRFMCDSMVGFTCRYNTKSKRDQWLGKISAS
jgi:hypothetical protein